MSAVLSLTLLLSVFQEGASPTPEKSTIALEAEKIIAAIEQGERGKRRTLFELFGDNYRPSLEWEPGLVPILIEGLKKGRHEIQFEVDRIFDQVTGIRLIWLCGTTFEACAEENQRKAVATLEQWWQKYKDKSRADWFVEALASKNVVTRKMAIARLSALFNQSFDYQAEGNEADRNAAVEKWRKFWSDNKAKFTWDEDEGYYAPPSDTKGPEPEKREMEIRIDEWIGLLGDEDYKTRVEATDNLLALPRSVFKSCAEEKLKAAGQSDDAETRLRARNILEELTLQSRKAVQSIRQQVADILQRRDAESEIARLARRDDLESAFVIVQVSLAHGRDVAVSRAAERAAKDPKVARALARTVRDSSATGHDNRISPSLKALFGKGVDHLLPYGNDPNPGVRRIVGGILASYGSTYLEQVKATLNNTEKEIRLAAIHGLGMSGDPKTTRLLLDHAKRINDADEQRWAILAAGDIGDDAIVEELGTISKDRKVHPWVSGAAAEAIGRIQSVRGLPVLLDALNAWPEDPAEDRASVERRQYVVQYIFSSIFNILAAHPSDKECWNAVEKLFSSKDAEIRLMALQKAKEKLGQKDLGDRLMEYIKGLLNDPHPSIQFDARQMIEFHQRRYPK